ncbi:hypothetical protein KC19_8G091900 [Ceratodon purpureus]|uniref:Uncharacterized protein n=1 Tax=Ceratodon purpureus TaxID=3225 RepID=A0A8T0H1G7_CERPU|nr:hypothetical protein KC19_8G091900 [Ceratodon purpureus]
MMGCFSTSASRVEKQRSSSVPRSGPLRSVIASKDSLTLLANKPVELPDPGSIVSGRRLENEHWNVAKAPTVMRLSRFGDEVEASLPGSRKSRTQILKVVEEGRTAFSGPIVGGEKYDDMVGKRGSRLVPNYESSCEAPNSTSCDLRTLRRTTSFGGRPQPLPLPVTEVSQVAAKVNAKANVKAKQEVYVPLPAPEDAGRRSRRIRSFTLEDASGLRNARRGRVAPVGGLPLPPPSLTGKLLPSLTAQEFADLVAATDDFAGAATPRGTFRDAHRTRVKDFSSESHARTVFRLRESAAHVR